MPNKSSELVFKALAESSACSRAVGIAASADRAKAQAADRSEVVAVIGPPALAVLSRCFGTMNDSNENIGRFVGEMNVTERGGPLLRGDPDEIRTPKFGAWSALPSRRPSSCTE